ncbi:hypothetical protein B0J13DRAFT_520728 [Dactylonectria estremocensis]|uniref:Uncharacterized protein n=1 Tax=Dactylonectria estremocensis TaxID=1079267 RepID=A0A9P9JA48_9HYPO|nr:hypothetical protein B0J13DRAFT_520728 [Dactylonectria estremocensis]
MPCTSPILTAPPPVWGARYCYARGVDFFSSRLVERVVHGVDGIDRTTSVGANSDLLRISSRLTQRSDLCRCPCSPAFREARTKQPPPLVAGAKRGRETCRSRSGQRHCARTAINGDRKPACASSVAAHSRDAIQLDSLFAPVVLVDLRLMPREMRLALARGSMAKQPSYHSSGFAVSASINTMDWTALVLPGRAATAAL